MNPSDHSETKETERRMLAAEQTLWKLVPKVATARQVREFQSERSKNRLAKAIVPFLESGESASAAEWKARASESYAADMEVLRQQYRDACEVIAEWDAANASLDSARSVLALQRTVIEKI